MDESPTRISRLKELMHTEYDGKQVLLAEKLERQADYISRIFNGKKALSGDLAREFERLLGKPKYWLDGDYSFSNTTLGLSAQAIEVAKAFDLLLDGEKPAIIRAVGAKTVTSKTTHVTKVVAAEKKQRSGSL